MNFKEYNEGLPQGTSPRGFRVGDRVVLPAIPEEDLPREEGTVISVPEAGEWEPDLIVVEVDERFRDRDDDGLREVRDRYVERLIPC